MSNSQAFVSPLDHDRNGCLCLEVQATLYGSFLISNDPPWTARALATGIQVILPGMCTLMYTVSSGEVLGIKANPSGTPPNSEGVIGGCFGTEREANAACCENYGCAFLSSVTNGVGTYSCNGVKGTIGNCGGTSSPPLPTQSPPPPALSPPSPSPPPLVIPSPSPSLSPSLSPTSSSTSKSSHAILLPMKATAITAAVLAILEFT